MDAQQLERRQAIVRILRDGRVRRQEDLARLLKTEGYEVTQSSVSRDLRELGVAKAGDHYILPGGDNSAAGTPFAAVSNFVTEVRTAGPSLTVVKTTTGTAQSVAVAIDDSSWSEVVGTISGDDTIFIATEGVREQRKLRERLREIFGI